METFYVTPQAFWEWFDRDKDGKEDEEIQELAQRPAKRAKTDQNQSTKPVSIQDTEAAIRGDSRYVVMYGPHKPGRKNKVWANDGYLTMVGEMAHLCDLRGRMVEEPTILDEIDYKAVEDMGTLIIGGTEISVVDKDK